MDRNIYENIAFCESRHWWHISRREIIKKILSSFLPVNHAQSILEIGCGSGGNLSLLSNYGHLFAVEMDNDARTLAMDRSIGVVKKGSLPNDIPFDTEFDLICLFDVLEHIEDDLGALISIRQKLKQRGVVFITVPAYQFLWSNHDVANQHKRRYRLNRVNQLLKEAGFKVLFASYFNTFLFPLILLARGVQRLFRIENSIEYKIPNNFFNTLLIKVFSSEKFFLPKISFPCGVSILLLAEKP